MALLSVDGSWHTAHPGASVGWLALGSASKYQMHADALKARCEALEAELRTRLSGKSRAELLAELPALQAYVAYYRRFKKSYHVLLQLESVVFKGRQVVAPMPLVQATFMAELQNLLLTATHDLDVLKPPVRIAAAAGGEPYTLLGGEPAEAKPGDMLMADADGVVCTVIAGQDARTCVTPLTRRALFVVYAPPGIAPDAVRQHLGDLEALVHLFAPDAVREAGEVVTAV
jgi:DNA/RNA-binding domain of Phe-tRNA-synthetase-like protein